MARHEIDHVVQVYQGGVLRPAVGAQVTVTARPGHGAAVWYVAESGGSGQSSAIVTDELGRIDGWLAPGAYYLDVVLPSTGETYSQPIDVYDPAGGGGGGGANAKGVAIHGSNASFARPTGYASIEWIGSVQPTNAVDNDTWVPTT